MSIHVHYNNKNKQNIGNHTLKIDMNYFEMQQWDNRGLIREIGNGKRSDPASVPHHRDSKCFPNTGKQGSNKELKN